MGTARRRPAPRQQSSSKQSGVRGQGATLWLTMNAAMPQCTQKTQPGRGKFHWVGTGRLSFQPPPPPPPSNRAPVTEALAKPLKSPAGGLGLGGLCANV